MTERRMENLFTPWRHPYITSPRSRDQHCFFCAAMEDRDDPERLVVHWTDHHLVILNRHPYTTGHLMVAPCEHLASPLACTGEGRADFWPLVLRCQEALEEVYRPDGLNFGLNQGRVAGAGVPGHFHFHLVCRWDGDTNFMGVVAGVRLIPEALSDTWRRLRCAFGHGALEEARSGGAVEG